MATIENTKICDYSFENAPKSIFQFIELDYIVSLSDTREKKKSMKNLKSEI